MKKTICSELLRNFHPDFGDSDLRTVPEFIWGCYTEYNPVQSEAIRCAFQQMDAIFCKLPCSDVDALFASVSSLCLAYEKAAFLDGLRLGTQLMYELRE